MNTYVVKSVCVLILVFSTVNASDIIPCGDEQFTFGDCEPGKEDCRDCYLTLVKSLLGNGANVLNLTNAFFPPNLNPPDSVIVTYHFRNTSTNVSSVWFWATSFGYFLHSMQYFQFISLLFGKPRPLYERTVEVTLDAKCLGADDQFMQVLTQRLKGYIQEQSINARVDDSHIASAVNNVSFDNLIRTYGNDAPYLVSIFSISDPLVISIFAIIIFIFLLMLQPCISGTCTFEQRDRRSLYTKRKKSAIISFVIIGFVRLLLIFALDSAAVHYTQNLFEVELERIHHNNNTEYGILYSTPFILLAFDIVFLSIYIVIVLALLRKCKCKDSLYMYHWLMLTLSIPIASILLHLPYIAIAYLNDANHAGSVLILHILIAFLEFIILDYTFIQYFNLKPVDSVASCNKVTPSPPPTSSDSTISPPPIPSTTSPPPTSSTISPPPIPSTTSPPPTSSTISPLPIPSTTSPPPTSSTTSPLPTPSPSHCSLRLRSLCFVLNVLSSLCLFYCIIGISVCFFYYLPINHSISSTSNQIIIIYQTGLVFVGAAIAYKTFFKRRSLFMIYKAIDDCEKQIMTTLLKDQDELNKWRHSTDQEKLIIFCQHIITYAIPKLTGVNTQDSTRNHERDQNSTSREIGSSS